MGWRRCLEVLLAGLIICSALGCGSEPATDAGTDPQAATAAPEEQADGQAFTDDFESGDTENWQDPEEGSDASDTGAEDSEPEP